MLLFLRQLAEIADFRAAQIRYNLFWAWVYRHLEFPEDRKRHQRALAEIRRSRGQPTT